MNIDDDWYAEVEECNRLLKDAEANFAAARRQRDEAAIKLKQVSAKWWAETQQRARDAVKKGK